MRLHRDLIFRVHTFGICFVAVLAVFLHRSADRKLIASVRRDADVLRSRVDELEKRPVALDESKNPGFIEDSSSSSWIPAPAVSVVGSGLLGSRRFYIDARLCDGVVRRCYIRRDERFKRRDMDFCIEYLRDLQDYLWNGGYDLSLASSPVSSSIDEEVSASSDSP